MDNKNTMLIIANIYIALSLIVQDALGWIFMFGIGMIWMIGFLYTSAKEIEAKKRMIMRLEIITDLINGYKKSDEKPKRSRRKK